MTNKSLRNAVGIGSLTALALTMVACGGSSSSTPVQTNTAPKISAVVPNGNFSSLITNHTYAYTIVASDAEGDPITFTATAGTISGTTLTYKPAAAAAAGSTITITANDGKTTSTFSLVLPVITADQAPTLAGLNKPTVVIGQSVSVALPTVDADGDAIAWAKAATGFPAFVTLNGNVLNIAPPTGTATGDFNMPLVATTTSGGAQVAVTNITFVGTVTAVPNTAPTANIPVGPTSGLLTSHKYTYNLFATDADGDPITFTVATSAGTLSATSIPANAAGAATVDLTTPDSLPAGGQITLTLTASDNKGHTSAPAFLSVQVANNAAPVFAQGTAFATATRDGETVSFNLSATDPNGDGVTLSVPTAPTGTDVFTFTPGANGTAVVTIKPSIKQLPAAQVPSTITFNVLAQDSTGKPSGQTLLPVTVTVNVNAAPVLSIPAQAAVREESVAYALNNLSGFISDSDRGSLAAPTIVSVTPVAGTTNFVTGFNWDQAGNRVTFTTVYLGDQTNRTFQFDVVAQDALGKNSAPVRVSVPITARLAPSVPLASGANLSLNTVVGGSIVENKLYNLPISAALGDGNNTLNVAKIRLTPGTSIPTGLFFDPNANSGRGGFTMQAPVGTTTFTFSFDVYDPFDAVRLVRTYTATAVVTASAVPTIVVNSGNALAITDEGRNATYSFLFSATADPSSSATIRELSYNGSLPAGVTINYVQGSPSATVNVDQNLLRWTPGTDDGSGEMATITFTLTATDTNGKIGMTPVSLKIRRTPKPTVTQGVLTVRAGNTTGTIAGFEPVSAIKSSDLFGTVAVGAPFSISGATVTPGVNDTTWNIAAATSNSDYPVSFMVTPTTTRVTSIGNLTRTGDTVTINITAKGDAKPVFTAGLNVGLQPLAPNGIFFYDPAKSDAENDPIPPANWTLVDTSAAGAGAFGTTITQDGTTGRVTVTAGANAGNTTLTFTLKMKDSYGQESAVQTVTVPVSNTTPVIQPPASLGNPVVAHMSSLTFTRQDPDRKVGDFTQGDTVTWSLGTLPSVVNAPALGATTGVFTWTPDATEVNTAKTFIIQATDSKGAIGIYNLQMNVQPDNKPNFRVQQITEQVSSIQFHDESNLRAQIDTTNKGKHFTSQVPVDGWTVDTGAAVTESTAFSNLMPNATNPDLLGKQSAGWRAAILADDPEKDAVRYFIKPNSVFFNGQPFTINGNSNNIPGALSALYPAETATNLPADTLSSPVGGGEYPVISMNTGEITWVPVHGSVGATSVNDPANKWSFTVLAVEYLPNGAGTPQAGQISEYNATEIRVQREQGLNFSALSTIEGGVNETVSNALEALSNVTIGGGTGAATKNSGRPSIQMPESNRYVGGVSAFPYDTANATKTFWRWLMATPGGLGLTFDNGVVRASATDEEVFDFDTNATTGHQDAYELRMGTPTFPAVDPGTNLPAMTAPDSTHDSFFNPWISNALKFFEVNWGPSRTQYLIARYTNSASYAFPVNVHEQYAQQGSANLPITPMFGTVRGANARTRIQHDMVGASADLRGAFISSSNEGDNVVNGGHLAARYTFTYLPMPSSTGGGAETAVGANLFNQVGTARPLSTLTIAPTRTPSSGTDANSGARHFLGTSWITLNSTETQQTGYHTGNPLNDEIATFNLPSYAQAVVGGGFAQPDWRVYKGADLTPSNDQFTDAGSGASNEIRAQVIPSNSPYLMSIRHNAVDPYAVPSLTSLYFGNYPNEVQGTTLNIEPKWYDNTNVANFMAGGWYYGIRHGEVDLSRDVPGRSVAASTATVAASTDALLWTYTWPTAITQSNLGKSATGTNKFEQADIMQMVVPEMGANGRFFFTGDAAAQGTSGWGTFGMSVAADSYLNPGPYSGGKVISAAGGTAVATGFTAADQTPFHVVTNSIWVPATQPAALGTPTNNFFNVPNSTAFSAGVGQTHLPFDGIKGYADSATFAAGAGLVADPGVIATVNGTANPGRINLGASGERIFFLWMKNDKTVGGSKLNAWANWEASMMQAGSPTVTGGSTTTPSFNMSGGQVDTDSQVSMASGNLPGVNHASNFGMAVGNTSGFGTWTRDQWVRLAPAMGPIVNTGTSIVSTVRLVNPTLDANTTRLGGVIAGATANSFFGAASTNSDGGIRDSAVIYAIRDRSAAGVPFGSAGIEPSSPVLAQYWNIQEAGDVSLTGALTSNSTSLVDLGSGSFPKVFQAFYSPFVGANWKHVLDLKMNFLAGVLFPQADAAANTIWKVPVSIEQAFPMDMGVVTDVTCTNPGNAVTLGNPIVSPVRLVRIKDYNANVRTGSVRTVIDLVNSWAAGMASPIAGVVTIPAGTSTTLNSFSTYTVEWQASVNNQVIPSGYILELFQVTGAANVTNQPKMLGSYRMGHIGTRDAIQQIHLPALRSMSGADNAAYFFKIRTVWAKDANGVAVDFEKAPYHQGIPYAHADFVTSVFVSE